MSPARTAIALPMALLILVGLMLLGLPFLFSQSASRAGAATVAARQAAHVYARSALNLGIGLGIYSQEAYRSATATLPTAWTDHPTSLTGGVLRADGTPLDTVATTFVPEGEGNRLRVIAPGLQGTTTPTAMTWNQDGQRLQVGLTIEDESGKLDGNSLGPLGWKRVLDVAGIEDRDIGTGTGDIDQNFPAYGLFPVGLPPRFTDLSPAGQLADAIVIHRIMRGPFRSLEDLLLVDPQAPADTRFNDPRQSASSSASPLYRPGLSRAELQRLRPLITFHTPGAGRQGMIDLGNQAAFDGRPFIYLDCGEGLLGRDMCIRQGQKWGVVAETSLPNSSIVGSGTVGSLEIVSVGTLLSPVGDGFAFQLPAPLNLNQATQKTLQALHNDLGSITNRPIKTLGLTDNLTLLPWLATSTLFTEPGAAPTSRFHPPLAIASSGIIRVEAQASVLDAKNRPVASETRTAIVQAVPQQVLLAAQWRDQEELQTLVDYHTGSRLATHPKPTSHGAQSRVAIIPDATGTDWFDAIGIRPGTLKSLADYSAAPPWLPAGGGTLWASFQENPASPMWVDVDQITNDGLLSQGTLGVSLAFANADATATPPVTERLPLKQWEDFGRHLSFWVCATDELTEATRLLDVQGTEINRSRLSLTWDPATDLLALRLLTPAFPASTRYRFTADDPITPANENALGWEVDPPSTSPNSYVPASNEILLAKYLGSGAFAPGRWHHIQVVVGSGGPESLALVVDGIAGRDLTRTTATQLTGSLVVGDYALLPAAVLSDDLPNIVTTSIPTTPGLIAPHADQTTPKISLSGFWDKCGVSMTLADIFPPQGILRLGREYLRYDQMTFTGDTGTIQEYWRGVRQDTVSTSSDPNVAYPKVSGHLTGELVLPGDFAVDEDSKITLMKGKARLLDDLRVGTLSMGTAEANNLTSLLPGTSIAITVTGGATWPQHGVFRMNTGHFFAFTRTGNTLNITTPIPSTATGPFDSETTYTLQVVSLACESTLGVEPTSDQWNNATNLLELTIRSPVAGDKRMAQISDPLMRNLEWISYNAIWINGDNLYLINTFGSFGRGEQRTRIQNWTATADPPLVRPIQNHRNGSRQWAPAHWFRPGDHLSYRAQATQQWHQVVVRYVAIDHHATPGTAALDSVNGLFTILDLPLGDELPDVGHAWSLGTGWSPERYPNGNMADEAMPALLPTAREWPAGTTTLVLGGPKTGDPSTLSSVPLLVDALATGPLPDHRFAEVSGLIGATTEWDDAIDSLTFTASTNALRGTAKKTGLALIDGEVVAYARRDRDIAGNLLSPSHYQIIGRGLLGSERRDHGTFDPARPWPILFLPIGPVRQLIPHDGVEPLAELMGTGSNNWFAVTEDPETMDRWSNPAQEPPGTLLMVPGTGTPPTYHGLHLIRNERGSHPANPYSHERTWCVPWWLTNLWSGESPSPTPGVTGGPLPLLIGWFPRYPSVLPHGGTLSPSHFRSRVFAWAGFATRMPRMRVDTSRPVAMPLNSIPGSTAVHDVQVRAMVGAINGDATKTGCLEANGWSNWFARPSATCDMASNLLNIPEFVDQDLDGLELRVTWHYQADATDLEGLSVNMNTTPPSIGPVSIPLKVPVAVLATE